MSLNWKTKCPACGAPITLRTIMAAPTPFHIKCPKCRAKLRERRLEWPLVALSVAYAGYFSAIVISLCILEIISVMMASMILIVGVVVFVFAVSLFMINKGRFEVRGKYSSFLISAKHSRAP